MAIGAALETPVDPRQRLLESTISDWVASHAQTRPLHTAFISGERRVPWADFDARVSRVANALIALGLARGDKVALLAPNGIEGVEVMFGTLRAGAVIVPLSTMLPSDVLARSIDDSEAKFLILAEQSPASAVDLRGRLSRIEETIAAGFSVLVSATTRRCSPKLPIGARTSLSNATTTATSSTAPAPRPIRRASSTLTFRGCCSASGSRCSFVSTRQRSR